MNLFAPEWTTERFRDGWLNARQLVREIKKRESVTGRKFG